MHINKNMECISRIDIIKLVKMALSFKKVHKQLKGQSANFSNFDKWKGNYSFTGVLGHCTCVLIKGACPDRQRALTRIRSWEHCFWVGLNKLGLVRETVKTNHIVRRRPKIKGRQQKMITETSNDLWWSNRGVSWGYVWHVCHFILTTLGTGQ